MPSNGSRGIGGVLGLLTMLGAASAWADPPATDAGPAITASTARDLFHRAVADEDAGRWAVALDKLHQVLGFKDTAGVRYHMALCEEKLGQLALAQGHYAMADTMGHAEQAGDVLRLVGKRLADIARRVPHAIIHLHPPADAVVTIDGHEIQPGEPTAVDPGGHDVEVTPVDHRPPTAVSFAVEEGETKTVDVGVSAAPGPAPPAAATGASVAPAAGSQAASRATAGASRHTAAYLEAGGAAVLAASGVLAFLAGGSAHDQALRSCALVAAQSASACDDDRTPVRAWDWVAVGAWAEAGALAAWAVVSFATGSPHKTPATVTLGAGSVHLQGEF